jgi:hypothetical protein
MDDEQEAAYRVIADLLAAGKVYVKPLPRKPMNILTGFAREIGRDLPGQPRGRSLAGVVAPLAAKANELVDRCGSRVISGMRHTYVAGTRRISLHASGTCGRHGGESLLHVRAAAQVAGRRVDRLRTGEAHPHLLCAAVARTARAGVGRALCASSCRAPHALCAASSSQAALRQRAVSGGVPLISDEVTIALVGLYAARRGINRNEALRRLVRTGLGVDPIGFWQDKRRGAKAPRDMIAAVRKLRPKRHAKADPARTSANVFRPEKEARRHGSATARCRTCTPARIRGLRPGAELLGRLIAELVVEG